MNNNDNDIINDIKNDVRLIMVRHAQSVWNRENRFSGWADPVLTESGRREAKQAGQLLKQQGYRFDAVYTSRLQRAIETAQLIRQLTDSHDAPMLSDWQLNERHYGRLQGLNKLTMSEQVGDHQVWQWRRSFLAIPPALPAHDSEHPLNQSCWDDVPREQLPNGESLAMTRIRVVDYFDREIRPQIMNGKQLLISSHGNTLRALLMALDDMSIDQVESFEIPTGQPIVYRFSQDGQPLGWEYLPASQQQAA